MTQLVTWKVSEDSDATVVVEVDEAGDTGVGEQRAGIGWKKTVDAPQTLEDSLERVKPAANTLLSKLRELAVEPDEATIQFGIKLTASAGAALAAAGVEANYSVTLTWRKG